MGSEPGTVVKPRHAATLALLLLTSCGSTKTATIDAATKRAEAALNRAQGSARSADEASIKAENAAEFSTDSAGPAEDLERSANDALSRVESKCRECSTTVQQIP